MNRHFKIALGLVFFAVCGKVFSLGFVDVLSTDKAVNQWNVFKASGSAYKGEKLIWAVQVSGFPIGGSNFTGQLNTGSDLVCPVRISYTPLTPLTLNGQLTTFHNAVLSRNDVVIVCGSLTGVAADGTVLVQALKVKK